jgi:HEAT repeat protein
MDKHDQARDREVEDHIMLAETPFGDGPHERERERAAAWLLDHAARAYPRLLAHLDEGRASVAVIELLPRFGRPESIPRLERLLVGPEPPAWAAGQALALQPQPAAGEALRRALASGEPAVGAIAADALGTRSDPGDCAALVAAIHAPDGRFRYHAVQAAWKVGCLGREALESLVHQDSDADIRGLAARLLKELP